MQNNVTIYNWDSPAKDLEPFEISINDIGKFCEGIIFVDAEWSFKERFSYGISEQKYADPNAI
jgi:hypothetical protein